MSCGVWLSRDEERLLRRPLSGLGGSGLFDPPCGCRNLVGVGLLVERAAARLLKSRGSEEGEELPLKMRRF